MSNPAHPSTTPICHFWWTLQLRSRPGHPEPTDTVKHTYSATATSYGTASLYGSQALYSTGDGYGNVLVNAAADWSTLSAMLAGPVLVEKYSVPGATQTQFYARAEIADAGSWTQLNAALCGARQPRVPEIIGTLVAYSKEPLEAGLKFNQNSYRS
ncbi:hypothetical protein FA95DRAFT_1394135 [Auriscalpium vulgare]|uniref:Uncharacterized protein n=1 Tax=Auriscalpium vulgare TaxID=40419 RepID=A0ACB8RQP5_9AGAM|nr:hypothetical protein FA95DRAFT_1394135 [Auriscalpium vulgare]